MKLTEREFTKAFKAKALQVHPDKRPPDQAAAAHSEFQNLTASYEILMDAKKRQEFNALLLAYLRWQQQQPQQQWRKIPIPRQPNMMHAEEERKKRQRVQEEEERKKRQDREKAAREKWKKIQEKVSKFFAEAPGIFEELAKEEAAAESKSRNASKTETTRLPTQAFQKFSKQDGPHRPTLYP